MSKVIVSYDGTANEDDAIALGRILGDAGAEVSLAYVRHTPEADRRAGSGGARQGRRDPRQPGSRAPRRDRPVDAARPQRARGRRGRGRRRLLLGLPHRQRPRRGRQLRRAPARGRQRRRRDRARRPGRQPPAARRSAASSSVGDADGGARRHRQRARRGPRRERRACRQRPDGPDRHRLAPRRGAGTCVDQLVRVAPDRELDLRGAGPPARLEARSSAAAPQERPPSLRGSGACPGPRGPGRAPPPAGGARAPARGRRRRRRSEPRGPSTDGPRADGA